MPLAQEQAVQRQGQDSRIGRNGVDDHLHGRVLVRNRRQHDAAECWLCLGVAQHLDPRFGDDDDFGQPVAVEVASPAAGSVRVGDVGPAVRLECSVTDVSVDEDPHQARIAIARDDDEIAQSIAVEVGSLH